MERFERAGRSLNFLPIITESLIKITDWINEHKEAIVSIVKFAAKALLPGGPVALLSESAASLSNRRILLVDDMD